MNDSSQSPLRRRGACAVVGVTVAVILAGCGSTVSSESLQSSGSVGVGSDGLSSGVSPAGAGDESMTPLAEGAPAGTGDISAPTVAGGDPASRRPGTGPGAGELAEIGTSSSAPAPGRSGRGFTAKNIYIGYLTWKDASRLGSAIGIYADYGDQEMIAKAIINDMNRRGGIAGRTVVPVFYDYQTADLSNPARGDQAACSRFTEDQPVFAVVAVTGILSEVLPTCLAKQKTMLVANPGGPYSREFFDKYTPYLLATSSPTIERYVPAWLARANAVGYFGGWDTANGAPGKAPVIVGVLVSDSPMGNLFDEVVRKEMTRQGHKVGPTFKVSSPLDSAAMNSAVLQFRSAGVTHVVSDPLQLLLFPQSAESQQYRPRYAIGSQHVPELIEKAAPAGQLNGALGAGFMPAMDVSARQDPGALSSATTRCQAVQRAGGQNPDKRDAYYLMVKACDGFWFLDRAVKLGGLSPLGVVQGARQIRSMPPAGVFRISFDDGRPDGIAAIRDLGFKTSCKCFMYLDKTDRPM